MNYSQSLKNFWKESKMPVVSNMIYVDGKFINIDKHEKYYDDLYKEICKHYPKQAYGPFYVSNVFLEYSLLFLHNKFVSHVRVKGICQFLSKLLYLADRKEWIDDYSSNVMRYYTNDEIRYKIKEMGLSHANEVFLAFNTFAKRD